MESTVHIAAFEAQKAENEVLLQRAVAAEKQANKYRKELATAEENLAQLSHELAQLWRWDIAYSPGIWRKERAIRAGIRACSIATF